MSGFPTRPGSLLVCGQANHYESRFGGHGYYLAHAAQADLCRRLGRMAEAHDSNEKALALVRCEPERQFLAGRLRELQ